MKIVVVGMLDTKGCEVGYLRDSIASLGHTPLVADPGILGQPAIAADITRQEIALAGGESLESLLEREDKAHAQDTMLKPTRLSLRLCGTSCPLKCGWWKWMPISTTPSLPRWRWRPS